MPKVTLPRPRVRKIFVFLRMNLEEELNRRLHKRDIGLLCHRLDTDAGKTGLLELALNGGERTAMNALWVFTHFDAAERRWLMPHRNELIDHLLVAEHQSHKRLILHLLENMPWEPDSVRVDFLDFCLAGINSNEPYAVRAFCLKLAYVQCRHYPEFMKELVLNIELMEQGELPPGLRCARRNILARIARNGQSARKQT